MSARSVARVLERLARLDGLLAPQRDGRSYGVVRRSDRRCKTALRLSAMEVRELASSGAIIATGGGAYRLTEAGFARAIREASRPTEAYAAQHRPIGDRMVMDAEADMRVVRGHDADRTLRRLAEMRDHAGQAWLDSAELAAAARIKADWERGELGLVRGSDWTAPPKGSTPRGPAAQDAAMAARCDARRRTAEALDRLAPPLRTAIERVVLREEGLEALERGESWPARSGKLALKLALAQLAKAIGQ